MTLITKLMQDNEPFTASSQDIRILQANNIKAFQFTLIGKQTGTASFTISDILGVLAKIQLKIGGDVISELSAKEFYIWNIIRNSMLPDVVLPIADGDFGIIPSVVIPVNHAPTQAEMAMRLVYSPLANFTDTALSIEILETKENLKEPEIMFQKYTFTPPSTGAYNILLDSVFGNNVIGFLIFSTTIPTATANVASCRKMKLRIGTDNVYENTWNGMTDNVRYNIASELQALIKNYAFLNFEDTPITKGIEIQIQVESDDLNPIEVIVILEA